MDKSKATITQTNPAVNIQTRIARTKERIAKWDKEAAAVEPSWTGGPAYATFCQDMATAAREKSAALAAELKELEGDCDDRWQDDGGQG